MAAGNQGIATSEEDPLPEYKRPKIRTMSRDEVLAAVTKGAKFPQRTSSA